ncbi:hypothetical protein F7725_013842 [Dissostichus mawsoni]|uniref:Uncharacterized protein n=1 Tax=Dissostichus mawsoni TaxID=36200 RepID=A0A7J5YU69_DISMA|nr:hypothetical protein F7725_013842 [Dissostichus mawsoni]
MFDLTACFLSTVSGFPAELSPNEISLKKAFALFQAMESMLERDAGEVLLHTHKVDEPLNGTMSDEKVERDDERRAVNGTMSEAKFNGTMSDEAKFNGTMSDEAKFNGTMSDEAKFNGTMSDKAKFNGTMSDRQSSTGR